MKPRPNTILRFSAAVALACTASAHATDYTWGGGNSTWADTSATDWNGGPPVSGDTATINTGTVTAAGDNQLTGVALTIGSAGVLNDGGFYTYFSPTGSLTLNGGTINITRNNGYYYGWYDGSLSPVVNANSGSSFINTTNASGGLRLEGDTTFSGDGNLTIGLGLHNWTDGYGNFGNTSITKSGAGTLTLSGANTYSGSTTVTAGVLSVGNGTNSSNLNDSAAVTVGQVPASGAKIDLNFTGTDIIGSLTLDGTDVGTGFFDATSHPTYFTGTGQLLVSGGVIADNNGTWASSADGYWENAGNWASNTIASGIDKTATFNGALGTTVSLLTNITIGNLAFSVEDYTLAGPSTLTLDASATPAISVTVGRTATITADLAGIAGMEKTGAGSLLLSGMKSYTGGTTVTGGTLELSGASGGNAQIHGSVFIGTGATLVLTGGDGTGFGYFNNPVTSITVDGGTIDAVSGSHLGFGLAASLTLDNGATVLGNWQWNGDSFLSFASYGDSTNTIGTGTITLRSDAGVNHTFTVIDGADATDLQVNANLTDQWPAYQGVPASGLTKVGTGTMVLNGTNTYDGNTVVSDGTLSVTASSSLHFRPTTNGATNSVSSTGSGTLSFLGTVDLDLSAANATNGNVWNLFNLASFTVAPSLSGIAGVSSNLGAFTEGPSGTWKLPVTGAEWVFTEADGNLAYVVTATDYDNWETANSVVGTETDDDDADGVTNFEEYAFGLDPTGGSSVNAIVVQLDKTTGTFSYTRRTQSLTGLTYSVWYSTDLAGWTEDTGAVEGTPTVSGEVETVPVTITGSLLTNPKLFIQVRAE